MLDRFVRPWQRLALGVLKEEPVRRPDMKIEAGHGRCLLAHKPRNAQPMHLPNHGGRVQEVDRTLQAVMRLHADL